MHKSVSLKQYVSKYVNIFNYTSNEINVFKYITFLLEYSIAFTRKLFG